MGDVLLAELSSAYKYSSLLLSLSIGCCWQGRKHLMNVRLLLVCVCNCGRVWCGLPWHCGLSWVRHTLAKFPHFLQSWTFPGHGPFLWGHTSAHLLHWVGSLVLVCHFRFVFFGLTKFIVSDDDFVSSIPLACVSLASWDLENHLTKSLNNKLSRSAILLNHSDRMWTHKSKVIYLVLFQTDLLFLLAVA